MERIGAPSLPSFVWSRVGMDRTAAQTAFSRFLSDQSLNTKQIRFLELLIDQLTADPASVKSAKQLRRLTVGFCRGVLVKNI